jgi:hypothetical protein
MSVLSSGSKNLERTVGRGLRYLGKATARVAFSISACLVNIDCSLDVHNTDDRSQGLYIW